MLPLRIASVRSLAPTSCGRSQLETSNAARPESTSRCVIHETGAMFVYQGQRVALEWQSPHALMKSCRVTGESHDGSFVVAGLVWLRPYGPTCRRAERAIPPTRARNSHRRHGRPVFTGSGTAAVTVLIRSSSSAGGG